MAFGRMAKRAGAGWPWLVLAGVVCAAVWHTVDFSEIRETDFPRVVRPFYNSLPPAAFRLAEPGDTLDRIGLYFSAGAMAIALVAVGSRLRSRRVLALWPSALAMAAAATWYASTPGPSFDGWHGLGWRAIFDPVAPVGLRVVLAIAALVLSGVVVVNLATSWRCRNERIAQGRERGSLALLVLAAVLVVLRQVNIPGVEPVGYWPRLAFDVGILAFGLALIRSRPYASCGSGHRSRIALAASWGLLVAAGIGVTVYHRPLARLRAVVPGKIYISAMPSYRGLAIEQDRLHFRTIINLFDEASTQASPGHEDEIRFIREHGLRYLGSPSDGLESDRFLDETLALARNPDAWPILVHCHGCMDRTPAWMGMYRFLVEGKPLADVFREIERHRGSRPKAVVTLLFNRKLPSRDPDHFAADPTARLLKHYLGATVDPYLDPGWNQTATSRRVVTRIEPEPGTRRP